MTLRRWFNVMNETSLLYIMIIAFRIYSFMAGHF